ncbi:MAG: hypothetical protein WCD11_25250 [Solirubrobacteraceae bacterium]
MPLITGSFVFDGASGKTISVVALVADALPPEFVAVTTASTVLPTSDAWSV